VEAFLTPAEKRLAFNEKVTNYINAILYRFYYKASKITPVSCRY
jgi:hypothetical protein